RRGRRAGEPCGEVVERPRVRKGLVVACVVEEAAVQRRDAERLESADERPSVLEARRRVDRQAALRIGMRVRVAELPAELHAVRTFEREAGVEARARLFALELVAITDLSVAVRDDR